MRKVFSNLAISLDGKIATSSREFFAIGSAKDLRLLRKLRDDADAIVYGAEVLRTFRRACLPLKKTKRLTNAVLSGSLKGIDPDWPFFKDSRIDRILYITGKVSAATRRTFEPSCEIVSLPGKSVAREMLQDLRKRKMKRVGVEGGGEIMWEFVSENLIEEYFVTIVPRILGGKTAPTLVDGIGFTPDESLNLKLERLRRVGSEVFSVYSPVTKRGKKHPRLSK